MYRDDQEWWQRRKEKNGVCDQCGHRSVRSSVYVKMPRGWSHAVSRPIRLCLICWDVGYSTIPEIVARHFLKRTGAQEEAVT